MVSYKDFKMPEGKELEVLILVVMEDGLVLLTGATISLAQTEVLILVVMEDGLVHYCTKLSKA